MGEPKAVATSAVEVVPSVWHWRVHDERIDFTSAGHAIVAEGGSVLIDPVGLAPEALEQLLPVAAICLTSGSHQRYAWDYRRELDAAVYAPALARTLAEEADGRYGDGDELPGGLRAVFTPGAGTTQHTLLLSGPPGVAFVPDLLARPPGTAVMLVPDQYMHDPDEARRSVQRLLELPFTVACFSHGEPLVDDPKSAIAATLDG